MAKKKNSKKYKDDQADSSVGDDESSANESTESQDMKPDLTNYVDQLSSPRPEIRKKQLVLIQQVLRTNYPAFPDDWNYKETLLFGIESILKRGKLSEQVEALRCLSIYFTQVTFSENQEIGDRFHEFLESRLCDSTKSGELRAACATTVAWLHYLSAPMGSSYIKILMDKLSNVFKNACLKGDGMPPDFPKAQIDLHKDCLFAWGLLFTSLSSYDADELGRNVICHLVSILQSKYMVVRMAACDVVALVYERIREETRESFKGSYFETLLQVLDNLSFGSNKYTSKADAKKQRSNFRDLLRFLRSHEIPTLEIKLASEKVELDTYQKLFVYQAYCNLLTLGINVHLQENMLLRQFFDLGLPLSPIPQCQRVRASDKKLRSLMNEQASKDRMKKLSKERDKRAVVFHDSP
nr:interferon developmental regulator [Hymenolepis microstoma]